MHCDKALAIWGSEMGRGTLRLGALAQRYVKCRLRAARIMSSWQSALTHFVSRLRCGPDKIGPPLCQAGFLPMAAIGKIDARIMSSWGLNVMSTSMLSERSGVDSDVAIPYMAPGPMKSISPRISEIRTVYVSGV